MGLLIGTSPQFSHVFHLNLRASHCGRRVRVVKGSADCFPSTAVNDSPSRPWSIAFSNSPHSTTLSQHTMATQSLRSSEFAEGNGSPSILFSLFLFFSFALHHKARVFRGLSLFSIEKHKTNLRLKKRGVSHPSRAKPQLYY